MHFPKISESESLFLSSTPFPLPDFKMCSAVQSRSEIIDNKREVNNQVLVSVYRTNSMWLCFPVLAQSPPCINVFYGPICLHAVITGCNLFHWTKWGCKTSQERAPNRQMSLVYAKFKHEWLRRWASVESTWRGWVSSVLLRSLQPLVTAQRGDIKPSRRERPWGRMGKKCSE